jgi:hypothetical protein
MVPPITSMVASNKPRRRASGCEELASGVERGELKFLMMFQPPARELRSSFQV